MPTMPTTDSTESPAERRAIVRALADALDIHDAEHIGAWGQPDEDGCPFC